MILKAGKKYKIICDSCGKASDIFDTYELAEEHAKGKDIGWTVRIQGTRVVDYCKECAEILNV